MADRFDFERAAVTAADYTTFTASGSGTITFTNDSWGFTWDFASNVTNVHKSLYKSLPASQKFDVIAKMTGTSVKQNYPQFGIFIGSTSLAKQVLLTYDMRSGIGVYVDKYTSGSYTATYTSYTPTVPFQWFRINCDATNLKFYIGVDGKTWSLVYSTTLANFVTSADVCGFTFGSGADRNHTGRVTHFEIVDNT